MNLELLPISDSLAVRRTTPDQVADLLRDAILTGRLEDGDVLNQVELSNHFSVSRVPIREALRQLQAEGLVRQEAHRKAVVSSLTVEHIDELFDLRVLLEGYMLRHAVASMDETTDALLLDQLEKMSALDGGDHGAWLAANRELHETLYRPSGASYTMELTASIASRTTRYLYLRSGGAGVHRNEAVAAEHRQIVDAALARDADRAVDALEQHINGTRRAVLDFLAKRSAGDHVSE